MLECANQGTVTNDNYNSEIPFRYIDGYIFIDIVQNGTAYNFLFDTGAEATVIDKSIIDEFQYKPYSTSSISGPLITNQDVNTITLSSMYVSKVEFINIGAVSIDMKFAKPMFCAKVDGIIGSTLLKKSKWQIDYEEKVIRFSDAISKLLPQEPAYKLTTSLPAQGWGTETIALNIDGYVSQFNFDTGNGRESIVLKPSELKNFIVADKNSIIEYGFTKSDLGYKLIAEKLTLGNLQLSNQSISFRRDVGNFQLVGNRFLENFLITIDWEKHQLYLEPTKNMGPDAMVGFELNFKPNFETNEIEIVTGLKAFTKKNKIRKGATLLKVNETDISNFSHQEFCDFWNMEWPKIVDAKKLNLVILQKGKSKEISITKKKLA
ncbi:hypothetical protein A7A78_08610 [Aequorivita soesokkakensis]|uniref:Peptidase A2 domain-containing protein n=2 Tax=Aequorivita soesokkakensis TaxID=1385699 RepID=A0A1A9LGF0_9FLAO|nr:hypothetical protein A7A78_08610 [Aequorivita soesokkakensis]